MRRLTAFFTLLTLLFTLTASAETPVPDLTGHWETAPEETLCGTLLTLTPDGHFYLTSKGVTYIGTWWLEGTWTQEDNVLTIHAENGSAYVFTQETTTGLLISPEGHPFYSYD